MRTLFTIPFLLLINLTVVAQLKVNQVNGTVNDANDRPLQSVTASLLKALDSSIVKLTISDKAGRFGFENK